MRPLHVMDELAGFGLEGQHFAGESLSADERDAALLALTSIVERLKPEEQRLPLTPAEGERTLAIVNALHTAVISARSRNPWVLRSIDGGTK